MKKRDVAKARLVARRVHAKASRRRFAPPSRPPPVRLPRAASPRERRSFSPPARRVVPQRHVRAQHVRAAGDGGGRVRLRADAHLGIRRPHLRHGLGGANHAVDARHLRAQGGVLVQRVRRRPRARARRSRLVLVLLARQPRALLDQEFPPRVGDRRRVRLDRLQARGQRRLVALRLFQPQTQSLHRRVGGPGGTRVVQRRARRLRNTGYLADALVPLRNLRARGNGNPSGNLRLFASETRASPRDAANAAR